MSQSDSRSFGRKPQLHAGNPLPFSPGTSHDADESRETLSDVEYRCFLPCFGSLVACYVSGPIQQINQKFGFAKHHCDERLWVILGCRNVASNSQNPASTRAKSPVGILDYNAAQFPLKLAAFLKHSLSQKRRDWKSNNSLRCGFRIINSKPTFLKWSKIRLSDSV